MSRSGPPGRTAEERNSTDPRVSDRATKTIGASGEVCPEVAEVVAQLGYVNPAKLAWLQQKAERLRASRDQRVDDPAVLTMVRHGKSDSRGGSVSRSVIVDATVGEFAARRAS